MSFYFVINLELNDIPVAEIIKQWLELKYETIDSASEEPDLMIYLNKGEDPTNPLEEGVYAKLTTRGRLRLKSKRTEFVNSLKTKLQNQGFLDNVLSVKIEGHKCTKEQASTDNGCKNKTIFEWVRP